MAATVASTTFARDIGIPNFRDLGGQRTGDGSLVRHGLLYRSTDLSRADARATEALGRLGVRTVFDLRTDAERERWPETESLPSGAAYVVADVLRDSPEATPAQVMPLLSDPARAREVLGDGRSERAFVDKYREFVSLASARRAYRRLLTELAVPDRLPAIVHCTTGKDRAGWAVATFLLLLGVPEAAVMDDYLASNDALEDTRREMLEPLAARGVDIALFEPMMVVKPAYLEAAFEEMRRAFGSLDGYLALGLRIGPRLQGRLRALFLEAG